MSVHIIGKEETILQMFPAEDGTLGKITTAIYEAISSSFEQQKMRNPTREEVKRRFTICINWAKTLRGDLHWGIERIIGQFNEILRTELLGQKYEPASRQCWIASDGV